MMATVNIQDMVWFVDNSAAVGGSGTAALPFTLIAEAAAASAAGDHIFVFEGNGFTTGMGNGIVLKDDQKLIGEGEGLTIAPFPTLVPPGGYPQISNIGGPGIILADNNEVRGVTVVGSQGDGIVGTGINGGTVDNVILNAPSGDGIHLMNTTGSFFIVGVTADDGSSGLNITGGSPTVNATGLTVSNSLGDGISVNSTAGGTFTFDDVDITNASGRGIFFNEANGSATLNNVDANGGYLDAFEGRTVFLPAKVVDFSITASSFNGSTIGNGIKLQNSGSVVTMVVDGGSASGNNTSSGIFIDATGGTTDVTIQNGTLFSGQNYGVRALHSATSTSTLAVEIDGETFSNQNFHAIDLQGTGLLDTHFPVIIRNTSINGTSDNGINMTHQADEESSALIENNTITAGQFGIRAQCGTQSGDQPNCNLTIRNNIANESSFLQSGVRVDNGFGSTMCLDIQGNTVTPHRGIELNQSGTGLVFLERLNGGVGSEHTAPPLVFFIASENPASTEALVTLGSFVIAATDGTCLVP